VEEFDPSRGSDSLASAEVVGETGVHEKRREGKGEKRGREESPKESLEGEGR